MKFRYARHTDNLPLLVNFYTKVAGLEVLGHFANHDHYNGVFLGRPNADWHLEFTESNTKAHHHPDDDDLLVFYLSSTAELNTLKKRLATLGIPLVKSKNPYWQKNGLEITDPDGYGVIFTVSPQH